ncbi:ARPP-2 domain-containing protein [Streptomyces thermolilacinus]|uniref:ARPP-2 domain-containing protein n=1 Tax=Streptomyces thermolilacinus TaxID=285540 RepID=UPI0033E7A468
MTRIDLAGLTAGPAQVWGGIRLVPLLRERPVEGLRLHAELHGDGEGGTGGAYGRVVLDRRHVYTSYIPHGFVADWSGGEGAGAGGGSGQGRAGAAYGTQLGAGGDRRERGAERGRGRSAEHAPQCVPVRSHHRMVKRVRGGDGGGDGGAGRGGGRRLRFLPLHLALEGYLALHFGGPSIVWEEWSRQAVRRGLSPREEDAYAGRTVRGLAEALRVFEIHPRQCGVMVYAGDALAAAFVVPHPDDYRALHPSLVQDLYGELVHQYALYGPPVPEFAARIDDADGRVRTLADLRAAARAQERAWTAAHDGVMARELLETTYAWERVRDAGPFRLYRFLPPFRAGTGGQHIGEVITDRKGRTAYLKTFRLSENQVRRGYVLRRLADCDWDLARTAEAMGTGYEELVARVRRAGFGELLDAHAVARRVRDLRGG